MRGGRAAPGAALTVAVAVATLGGPRAGRADDDVPPLVLLVQGDAVAASRPEAGVASDPPPGTGLRLRRVRAGNDVSAGVLRVRAVLEARQADQPYGPLDGGRIVSDAPVRLTDAFVAFIPHRAFEIAVGSQRVPFSLSRQVDEADLRLPERAALLDQATPDFRAGVAVGGDLGLLQYRGAVMAADPALDRTFSGGTLLAFRLGADPIGPMGVEPWRRAHDQWDAWWRFSAGASILYGTLLEPRTLGAGGDAQFQWRRFTATGEYLFLRAPAGNRQGAVVEPGFFVVRDRVELVLRGAWSRLAPDGDGLSAGGAATLYAAGGHLRLQAGFEKRRDSDWALVRGTIVF